MAVTQAVRVVLDTSAYSHFRRGSVPALELIAAASIVYVPVIVLGELYAGFSVGSRAAENLETLRAFLAEPFVQVFDVDADVARRYGDIFAALRSAGTPIPTNDIWIAATTMVTGGHLITFDADFGRIAGLPHTLLS